MSERFTDTLKASVERDWSLAVRHRFIQELCQGTVPATVMTRYLVQDHRFIDGFLMLVGAAMASSDSFQVRIRFGRSAGFIAGDENTYFLRSFEFLGVAECERTAAPDHPSTAAFDALMREAAGTRSYAAILSVLCVAEWLYLDWASHAPRPLPSAFVHAEWITLHDNPDFREFVAFLRIELDRVGPLAPETSHDFFSRAVTLEKNFFDEAYNIPS